MLDYSIIIPAYNEAALLPATLAALAEAMAAIPERQGEIIVADNDSTDDTADLARAAGARVVHEPHRQIGRARNAGAAVATGRYLVFVDADTQVSADLLRAALDAATDPGVVGGGTVAEFDNPGDRYARFALGVWRFISVRFKVACGAFIFCRRDAFEAVGGFDCQYYAGEELFLSRALAKWGRRQRPRARFRILAIPIITSDRKMQWYSRWQLTKMIFGYLINPWRTRRRADCALWYDRPAAPAPAAPLPPTSDPGTPPR